MGEKKDLKLKAILFNGTFNYVTGTRTHFIINFFYWPMFGLSKTKKKTTKL